MEWLQNKTIMLINLQQVSQLSAACFVAYRKRVHSGLWSTTAYWFKHWDATYWMLLQGWDWIAHILTFAIPSAPNHLFLVSQPYQPTYSFFSQPHSSTDNVNLFTVIRPLSIMLTNTVALFWVAETSSCKWDEKHSRIRWKSCWQLCSCPDRVQRRNNDCVKIFWYMNGLTQQAS